MSVNTPTHGCGRNIKLRAVGMDMRIQVLNLKYCSAITSFKNENFFERMQSREQNEMEMEW